MQQNVYKIPFQCTEYWCWYTSLESKFGTGDGLLNTGMRVMTCVCMNTCCNQEWLHVWLQHQGVLENKFIITT